MPQFFISSKDIKNNTCTISGRDYFHLIKSRRIIINDNISLRDENGTGYKGIILSIDENEIIVKIIESDKSGGSRFRLTLYMAVLKGKKFDLVIQKSAELGIGRIVPVLTERTIPDYGEGKLKKTERWKKIAAEASKQCMREDIPEIGDVKLFSEILDDEFDLKIIAHPEGENSLKRRLNQIDDISCAGLIIGPEGGFSRSELKLAGSKNWEILSLMKNHLRGETAAIIIPAVILYELS